MKISSISSKLCSTIPACKTASDKVFLMPVRASYLYCGAILAAYLFVLLAALVTLDLTTWLLGFFVVYGIFFVCQWRICGRLLSVRSLGFDGQFFLIDLNNQKIPVSLSGDVVVTSFVQCMVLRDEQKRRWPIVLHKGCASDDDLRFLRRFLLMM